jgi:hypothetical protein
MKPSLAATRRTVPFLSRAFKESFVRTQRLSRALAALLAASCTALAAAQSVTQLHVVSACSQGPAVDVTIDLASASQPIAGGQFFLSYDTSRLQYLGATADAAFSTVVHEAFDSMAGTIDYAVQIPFAAPMVSAPARFATLHFSALGQFCAGDNLTLVSFRARPNPLPPTRLTDTDGNSIATTTADLAAFTVDTTAPSITTPAPVVVSTNAFDCFASVSLPAPAASDNCGAPTVVGTRSDSLPLSSPYPIGPTTVTWTATDCAGNSVQTSQLVTVNDDTPPTISSCGVDQHGPADFSCQAPLPDFTAAVVASDNCTPAGSLVITQSPLAGTLVGPSPTTVTITVTDAANNASTCQRMFTIDSIAGPTATAAATGGSDIICSTGVVSLHGTATNYASVHWTGGSGSFANPFALDTIYTPGPTDANFPFVTLTLEAISPYSCVPSAFATVNITVQSAPTPPSSASTSANNFCTGSIPTITLMASGGAGAQLVWSSGSCTGAAIGTGSPLMISAPTTTTTYFAHWVNACGPSSCASITVNVVQPPTANAGAAQSICANGVASLSGAATNFSSVHWTGGDGSFTNANILNPIYTPGPGDVANGSVVLTLTAQPLAACSLSPAAVSTVTITILHLPTAPMSASSSPSLYCVGSVPNITLTAVGGSGLQLNWYAGSCDGSLVGIGSPLTIPAPATTTTYYARWVSKCGASTCAATTVTVSQIPTPPTTLTTSDDNFCNGGNVISIILSALDGTGDDVEWFTGSCGGTAVATGNPIVIPAPTSTTTYYARWAAAPCAPSTCASITVTVLPTTGACCNGYGFAKSCTVVSPASCAGPTTPSHAYRGNCTVCGPTVCCPADYNNNGVLEVADIFAFINDWFLAASTTDFDNSGTLQVSDIFTMLNTWFAGC